MAYGSYQKLRVSTSSGQTSCSVQAMESVITIIITFVDVDIIDPKQGQVHVIIFRVIASTTRYGFPESFPGRRPLA